MADELPREKIERSRTEERSINTNSLEQARQWTPHTNRPLSHEEKQNAPSRWVHQETPMAEKRENPVKRKSQDSDDQNKDTQERVDKQDVTKETTGKKGAGDFITGTATPDKQG